MHSVLAYYLSAGVNDNQVDMNAIVDPSFVRRGGSTGTSHWLFQVPLQLMLAYYNAAHAKQAVFNVPDWNVLGRQAIYPATTSLTNPSNPQLSSWLDYPTPIPMGQEIAVIESNTLGAGNEDTYVTMWVAPLGPTPPMFQGRTRFCLPFTASPTLVANTWSTDYAITTTYPLTGGSYVINGCRAVCPNGLAFRINFVRAPMFQNMKLYPGWLCENAFGNIPPPVNPDRLGPWGAFNNLELPQIAVLGTTAGAQTLTGYMDVTYVGPQQAVPQLQAA